MKLFPIFVSFYLLTTTALTVSYATEVRICNKSEVVFNNIEINSWKYTKLDIGECTAYYKSPLAQKYISIAIKMNGKRLSYNPKGTPIILEEGHYSYEISLADDHLQLETIKN